MKTMQTAILLLFPFFMASASAQVGIASHYPGDRGINYDPDVLFTDDFESYTNPSQLTESGKWSKAYRLPNLQIATEAGNFYAGQKALEFKLPISTTAIANSVKKVLATKQDTLFIRAYIKFDSNYQVARGASNHTGVSMSGNYPGPGQGTPADGRGWFLFLLQNDVQNAVLSGETYPGFAHIYAYWPKQRDPFGDHWYPDGFCLPYSSKLGADGKVIGNRGDWLAFPAQYPNFVKMPNVLPARGQWFCYELMTKLNTPGAKDGEVKIWYNGKVAGDFTNLFIRSISTLKIDQASIGLQATHSEHINKKWYDNVVVAKKYIGPMTPFRP
jgi:hypothetical protein